MVSPVLPVRVSDGHPAQRGPAGSSSAVSDAGSLTQKGQTHSTSPRRTATTSTQKPLPKKTSKSTPGSAQSIPSSSFGEAMATAQSPHVSPAKTISHAPSTSTSAGSSSGTASDLVQKGLRSATASSQENVVSRGLHQGEAKSPPAPVSVHPSRVTSSDPATSVRSSQSLAHGSTQARRLPPAQATQASPGEPVSAEMPSSHVATPQTDGSHRGSERAHDASSSSDTTATSNATPSVSPTTDVGESRKPVKAISTEATVAKTADPKGDVKTVHAKTTAPVSTNDVTTSSATAVSPTTTPSGVPDGVPVAGGVVTATHAMVTEDVKPPEWSYQVRQTDQGWDATLVGQGQTVHIQKTDATTASKMSIQIQVPTSSWQQNLQPQQQTLASQLHPQDPSQVTVFVGTQSGGQSFSGDRGTPSSAQRMRSSSASDASSKVITDDILDFRV